MDNDIKVEKIPVNNKAQIRLFLKEELLPLENSQKASNAYDLSLEYAKTRKNKSYFILGMMAFCVIGVAIITFSVVHHLSQQNKKIEIASNVFNDLDMSSLLGTRSHVEMENLIAENNLNKLKKERDYEIALANGKRDSDLQLLNALRYENVEERRKQILSAYNRQIKNISNEFDAKIQEAEKKAESSRNSLSEIDSKNKDINSSENFTNQVQHHERTSIVSSYKSTINELENQLNSSRIQALSNQTNAVSQLADKYHSEVDSLDPVIEDSKAAEIVKKGQDNSQVSITEIVSSLPQAVLTSDFVQGMKKAAEMFDDYAYLHDKVENIPQKNTIDSYKKSEGKLVNGIGKEIGSAVASQINSLNDIRLRLEKDKEELLIKKASLEEKNGQLNTEYEKLEMAYNGVSGNVSMFESWFESQAENDLVQGYILDKSDPQSIKVFVVKELREKLYTDTSSIPVVINHGKRKKVSEGSVYQENGICYFKASDSVTVEKISNGDRIMILSEE